MDVAAFLDKVRRRDFYDGQLHHVEVMPERPGHYGDPARPLPPRLKAVLAARGIDQLYVHQVAALEHVRRGKHVVVVTGTASGKTLCYHLPILEQVIAEPRCRALYLFPTKALAQDQLKNLTDLVGEDAELAARIRSGVFDGDTPTAERRRIKAEAQLVLSNPDMLHASILPYHPKWGAFFSDLKFVVLDEVHTYRGILGANVACVLRRLARICAHYGSEPTFIATSATIANPGELTSRLIGQDVEVIDCDGAPRGRKYFALWNPRAMDDGRLGRQSATDDAVTLMTEALLEGAQALAFTRTRQAAELVHRYVKVRLDDRRSPLAQQVRAYRGGYLPLERREIERQLFSGALRGVAATNALELGIDVGSLDVAILVGYPGTIASTWQQAGRSGRRHAESLAVLIAGNDPVDQYLWRYPEYFFARSPEHAVVDPENPYVLANHLRAAAFELPLDETDVTRFGPMAQGVAQVLADCGEIAELGGRFYFAGGQNPSARISLRHMSDNTFSIVLRTSEGPRTQRGGKLTTDHEVIANVDAISAPELVYPEAVYLHNGEPYLVRELDLNGKVAYVERRETDYYTQAVLDSTVTIKQQRATSDAVPDVLLAFGDVDVTWQTVAFKKIKFATRENIGQGPVDIPAQTLATTALWLAPDAALRGEMKAAGLRTSEALVGLRNLAIVSLPMVAMCDSRDMGGIVDTKNLGQSAMLLYDRYPGGLGYSEKGFHNCVAVLEICREMVASCPCADGCPSCVGLPNLRPAIHSDPDLSRSYAMPNKQATLRLLELIAERLPGSRSHQEAGPFAIVRA